MNTLPQETLIVLSALPLLGLGILAVVLFALGSNRDRYILPGALAVLLAVSTWGAAKEYGPRVKALIAKPAPAAPGPTEVATNEPDVKGPADKPADAGEDVEPPKKEAPTLIPIIDDARKTEDRKATRNEPYRRREIRVSPDAPKPPAEDTGPNTDKPAPRPEIKPPPKPEPPPASKPEPPKPIAPKPEPPPAPKPEPPPAPKPEPPPPPKPELPPAPKPEPAPAPKPEPPPAPKPEAKTTPTTVARNDLASPPAERTSPKLPSAGGGAPGTLEIHLNGTIVQNATKPSGSPHLLVILDGRQVEIRQPTTTKESYINNDPSQALQGVLYTWEGITITFSGLDPGFHFVMIDASLDSPSSHQANMLGAGKDNNAYNGTVEIKAGEGAVMEFGNANPMSGKLTRRR